ncbi:stonustoxin subunit beta-like [Stegastes partitus]|uniref:Stonustoxin subunit beta-like n=1 Tax=Stegastes partitus TaxID=144197 RepID=A0A9Y4K952_9TELE|nr:PREDICTED: stonustoxin subunit beta-like [Stegastes partitus]
MGRFLTVCSFRVDHGGEHRLKRGLQKYACELTLDPNTAHRSLLLSEDNKRVTSAKEDQPHQFHPDRFDTIVQLLCSNGLTGRCYWEVKTKNCFTIGVTYRGISRRGKGADCQLGGNDKSWSLCNNWCSWQIRTRTRTGSFKSSDRIAVYLDWPAGSVSFYRVSSDTLIHLYTFYSRFTEPLYPGFGLDSSGYSPASVSLCPLMSEQSQTEV